MKKITLLLFTLLFVNTVYGQSGWLPDVNFPPNSTACDNTPWQLVFQDDFNGTNLNPPWLTFDSWAGMPGGDNDNWENARCWDPYAVIWQDNNVVVGNGTCKLKIKKETASWHCATCTMPTRNTNYTSGYLALSIDKPSHATFNAGKFEARIKMPTFSYAHCTFWLWGTSYPAGINEIDIAEAYGSGGSPSWAIFGYAPKCNYSLHAWAPPSSFNQYNLPNNIELRNSYPHQGWWDQLWGNYFQQQNWHTYTCEWDTAVIKNYLDGSLVNTIWKYYRDVQVSTPWNSGFPGYYTIHVGSGCNVSGSYHITKGFPYNNQSNSKLEFTASIDDANSHQYPNGELGQMEIDYVKAWQRHPDHDWKSLCNIIEPIVTGPNIICNDPATYTVNPPSSSGYWVVPSGSLIQVSANSNTITVKQNVSAVNPSLTGKVGYQPAQQGCPVSNYPEVDKFMDVGVPFNPHVLCVATNSGGIFYLNMHAEPANMGFPNPYSNYNSATQFFWTIAYGPNYISHQNFTGQYISTNAIPFTNGGSNNIKWTLTIINKCGSAVKTGKMTYYNYGTSNHYSWRKAPIAGDDTAKDDYYPAADITNIDDYQKAVVARVDRTMFNSNDSDESYVASTIGRIQLEELAPYIIYDSLDIKGVNTSRLVNSQPNASISKISKCYPNPTNGNINFLLGDQFVDATPITINVCDMTGRLRQTKNSSFNVGDILNMDINALPNGIYYFEITQNKASEHFKILKQ